MNTNGNKDVTQEIIKTGKAYAQAIRAFDVLEPKAGWFEKIQIKLLRYSYRQRLRHLVLVLPSDIAEEILRKDKE